MLLSRYRTWLFFVFVFLFFITAASVLFFAFGYRYSFDRGIFIFSGSITLKTIPEVVNVELDGEPVSPKSLGIINNSIHLTGLMPGTHTLRISAPDYLPWEKHVLIESGVSREFWNVILARVSPLLTWLPNTLGTERMFSHPRDPNRFLLIKTVGGETSLVILNRQTGSSTQVFALPAADYQPATGENAEWSWFNDGRYVLLPIERHQNLVHLLVDTTNGSFSVLEDELSLSPLQTVRWETDAPNSLLFLHENKLYHLSVLPSLGEPEIIHEDVLTYTLSDDTLYLVTSDGLVWQARGDRFVTISPSLPLSPSQPLTLSVYDSERFAVFEHGNQGRLFLVYPDPTTLRPTLLTQDGPISLVRFSNDGKKLLFSNEHSIGVAFANNWDVQPRRQAGDIIQVARFSETIGNVEWAESYEHVIFSLGNQLKFIELDGRDQRLIGDIATTLLPASQILTDFGNNILFVAAPDSDIRAITFPEPQTLFGR